MVGQRIWALGCAGLLATMLGCARPSEERAERDLRVGIASSQGVDVHVHDGLAVVRELAPGKLALWASAPVLEVDLHVAKAPSFPWIVDVHNAMPNTDLIARDGDHELAVEAVEDAQPTHKQWRVQLPSSAAVTLHIGPPDAALRAPFRFMVLSDVQNAVDRVQDIFTVVNGDDSVAFLLGAGDVSESGGADQMAHFQDELRTLSVPYFTTLGNHDVFTSPTPWHDHFGRCSFHFRYKGVVFSLLDAASGTLDPTVYDWLQGWLREGKDGVHVVAMHLPPIDPIGVRGGGFASRNEAAKLLATLARDRVDATFYGHIHSFYSFENAGIPAYISGGGGAIPERFDGIGRHVLAVDVDPDRGVDRVEVVRVD